MTDRRKSPRSEPDPETGVARARRFLWPAVAVAIVGEGGHRLFDAYGTTLGHHVFHIVTIGAATVLFAAIVAADIRRNGRPHFSWRLNTPPGRTSGR